MAFSLRRSSAELDMTKGSIAKNIIIFSLPLIAGNLFQQLYNMVDTWVIGQTGENGAYAAVGSVGPIINILLGFFSGLASGAGVVISQYYGAKQTDKVKRAVHTSFLFSLLLGLVLTVLGLLMTPWLLNVLFAGDGDAKQAYPFALSYLRIYFSGILGMFIYNMGAGILRAVGDSRRPFYFLCVSAVTNTVLDLVFVFRLGLGVAGVAWATVIAQWISAVLVFVTLLRTSSVVKISLRELKFDPQLLGSVVKIGIPSALQLALTAFSNVFVQSYIAHVRIDQTFCLGGWTTYSKLDQLIFLPIQSLAVATTTFVGQNLGVGDVRRARRGTLLTYLMASAVTVLVMIPVMLFAPQLSRIFNADPNVVRYSVLLLRTITPLYLCCCANQVFSGALRGAGNSRAPMLIMLSCFVGVRQLYLYIMANYVSNEILPIAIGYPVGWLACCVITVTYYLYFCRHRMEHASLVKHET